MENEEIFIECKKILYKYCYKLRRFRRKKFDLEKNPARYQIDDYNGIDSNGFNRRYKGCIKYGSGDNANWLTIDMVKFFIYREITLKIFRPAQMEAIKINQGNRENARFSKL